MRGSRLPRLPTWGRWITASSDALTVLFSLAQSIELTLKAFLQPRGYNQQKRRREIGHDLPPALRAAVAVRFPPPHPSDEKRLQLLDDTYRGRRRLQYRVASALTLPLLRPVRELAELYLVEAHRTLTSRIADRREVRGLGIDPAAEDGQRSLEQFRAGA